MLQNQENRRTVLYLGTLLLLKLLLQLQLYRRGFLSVSADEFSRGLRAAKWASNPRFDPLADIKDVWLPFEKYVNGLVLTLWSDVILAPRLTVFIASCLLIIALYLLVQEIFRSHIVAFLTALLVILWPWTIWLSGTPMLEMYYLAFFVLGLYFLVRWLREKGIHSWLWAGSCFFISSAFHVQAWIVITVAIAFTLGYLIRYVRARAYDRVWRLLAVYVISSTYPVVFVLISRIESGLSLELLGFHSSYSDWFYREASLTAVDRLLFLPELLARSTSTAFWILFVGGLLFLFWDSARRWKLFTVGIAVLTLVISSAAIWRSGPPSAAPDRYTLLLIILLAPVVGYAGARSLDMLQTIDIRGLRTLPILAYGILYLFSAWLAVKTVLDYPVVVTWDAIHTGREMNYLLDHSTCDSEGKYIVELRYWDYLAIELAAGHYNSVLYDRERDLRDRDTRSIFGEGDEAIADTLVSHNICLAALASSDLKETAQQSGFLEPLETFGEWTIYRVTS